MYEIFLKIFLLEYITAGGLNHLPLNTALLKEATLMRDALLRDFGDIAQVQICTTYDARLAKPMATKEAVSIDCDSNTIEIWQDMLLRCDVALIIAPETDGVLAMLSQLIEKSGVINLGSNEHAVNITSNKYFTYQLLKSANILTIPTYRASEFSISDFELERSTTYITKPIDGAGCENTMYFNNLMVLEGWFKTNQPSNLITQPYQAGIHASISALCKNGKAWVLGCNSQEIELNINTKESNYLEFKGCQVNSLVDYYDAFSKVANNIATALTALNGYVGIDVIVHGEDIYVVEINPRITTSYIGLRESLGLNPAQLMLNLANNADFELPNNMTSHQVEISLNA